MSEGIVQQWNDIIDLPGLLLSLGEDLNREGLENTPKRIRKAYEEFFEGYTIDLDEVFKATFDAEGGGVQVIKDISYTSMCEHHLMPFYGYVNIAYEARTRVLGLSKLARLVAHFAKRLQIQERLTNQIADALYENLDTEGLIVVASGTHLCCKGRGVKQNSMNFVTQADRGNVSVALLQALNYQPRNN